MGSKQSRNTEKKLDESSTSSKTQELNIWLFPGSGASTFSRQLINETIRDENQIDACCNVLLSRMEDFDEFCSMDEEFARLKNLNQFDRIPRPREMLTRIWKHDEMRRILLEKYFNVWRLENLTLFMEHLLNGNFDNRLENPLIYASQRTTGFIVHDFLYSNPIIDHSFKYKMIEIGGSRNEWKKVFACFDNVHFLFFFYGLSDFDNPYTELEYEKRKFNYTVTACKRFQKFNPNCRIIVLFTKPDILQSKLKRGVVYENLKNHEMREELKRISNENERMVINSMMSEFFEEHETEYHIVNLLNKEEVNGIKDLIFSGVKSRFPFISKCLRESGREWKPVLWRIANNSKLCDISLIAQDE
ncbi:predicted protein [Naegleria gruberi]|uniref:Predicted protein n=1 Tax=Naegleria gruberi TaxID=5762 RepID=D2VKV9_NAEGR|nr:uncharacterized protein NAEGRDRAFT_50404 [Naegleria gruberi]EFC42511.1 predicted protein [Naegleria gruberi]|eukprot:XP_002675255.1 predicted protein [Naegleria gruberi strain NEG-M]